MKNLIYEEKELFLRYEKYISLSLLMLIIVPIFIFNILRIEDYYLGEIRDELILEFFIVLFIIDLITIIGAWLILWRLVLGHVLFQIYEDGFIPPIIPKNRRKHKDNHFISVEEIKRMDIEIHKKEYSALNNVEVTLKDGTSFIIAQDDCRRRGIEALREFKLIHGIPGDQKQHHPTLGWLKNEEIDQMRDSQKKIS
jgi:hypothetical protein